MTASQILEHQWVKDQWDPDQIKGFIVESDASSVSDDSEDKNYEGMASSHHSEPENHPGPELFDPEGMFKAWKGNYGKYTPSLETPLKIREKEFLNNERIKNVVLSKKLLGKGGFGTVYRVEAEHKKDARTDSWEWKSFALKVIRRRKATKKGTKEAMNDMLILQCLRHRNICNMVDYVFIPDPKNQFPVSVVCLFLDLCHDSFQNLYEEITMVIIEVLEIDEPWALEERLSKHWFKDITTGLEYLHKNGVAHLDIKEANILFVLGTPKEQTFVSRFLSFTFKLTDFGLSKHSPDPHKNKEGIKDFHEMQERDIESLLQILFKVTVPAPIYPMMRTKVFDKWLSPIRKEYKLEGISPELLDLMKGMHRKKKRWTAYQILEHQWVKDQWDPDQIKGFIVESDSEEEEYD